MTPLTLHTLSIASGSRPRRRRIGRGNGSRGTYSGRGSKGQRSRTGGTRGIIRRSMRSVMERVAKKRGFTSRTSKLVVVNVSDLETRFSDGASIGMTELVHKGLLRAANRGVKILGMGTVTKKFTVRAHAFSATAREAIEKAGGKAVVVGVVPILEKKIRTN